MDQKISAAVTKAVAAVEARYEEKSRVELAEFRKAADEARTRLILAEGAFDKAQMRERTLHIAEMVRPGEQPGDPK
jgi:hypothetical protein